jgi:hypothetical protein
MFLAVQKFFAGVVVGVGAMGALAFLFLTIGSGVFAHQIGTGSYIVQIVLAVPAVGFLALLLGLFWANQPEKQHIPTLLIFLGIMFIYLIGVLIFSFNQRFGMF